MSATGDLHLCIGFYPNGQFKTNTVSDEHLENNIKYNKMFRPGRFYFVDGEYVCGGMFLQPKQDELIASFKQKIADLGLKPEMEESVEFV